MDDLGATVPYELKSCNLRCTKICASFDWMTLISQIFCGKINTIKFCNVLLISSIYLLQIFSLIHWPTSENELCKFTSRSRVAIFFYINKLHHFNLRGCWWCLKEDGIYSKKNLNQIFLQNIYGKKINQSKRSTIF